MHAARAALLAALLLAPLLPLAHAAAPEPRPWSTYSTVSEVAAIAMAREGTTVAAALKAAVNTSAPGVPTTPALPGVPSTSVAGTDLTILDHAYGFARNGTDVSRTPLGRSHVAVSRDGLSVATIGIDGATPATQTARLHYLRIPAGGNWTGATAYERSVDLGAPASVVPVALAMSDDGRRVAVLTGEGANYVLRGYAYGSTLDTAFEARAPGAPRALAVDGAMQRLVVAGQFPEGNFTYGGAFVLPFGQGEPIASWFDRSANNSDVRSAAIARDGVAIAIGGTDGRAHLFRSLNLQSESTFNASGAGVNALQLSDNGARLAIGAGNVVALVNASAPAIMWNATVGSGNLTGLALSATGEFLVASAIGAGVVGFDESEGAPIWSIPGDVRGVALSADGSRVAYALRNAVGAAALPRFLTLDLGSGAKVAPQRTLQLPGNTSYEMTLRNDGAAVERVVFEEGAPEIAVSTEPRIIVLRPSAILRVNVTITVDQALPGPRVFNVSARSLSSGLVDNVTLSIAPRPTLDIKLQVNGTDVLAEPGRESAILLTIVNNGTSDAAVTLRATQAVSVGGPWNLTISESSLTALRGTRTAVKVLVTPPASVANGTSSTVTFTLEGQDVFDTARVTFRVNPDLKVEVNATGVTKFIEPGKRASYNVTVTNTGSLPRQFEIFYTITESSGRSWGVDMQSSTIRLDPLQKRTFPVTVTAPADAQPNERVAVLVTARSLPEQVNETAVNDTVTLFGVAIPLKITTTTPTANGIPFVTPAAAVAITLVAAALLGRRQK